jgi:hypothetical protein
MDTKNTDKPGVVDTPDVATTNSKKAGTVREAATETPQGPLATEVAPAVPQTEAAPQNELGEEEIINNDVELIVVKRFKDKFNQNILYRKGQCYSFKCDRAKDLVNRGLAQYKTDGEG